MANSYNVKFNRDKFRDALESGALDNNPWIPVFLEIYKGNIGFISITHAPPSGSKASWEIKNMNVVIQIGDDLRTSYGPEGFDKESLINALPKCTVCLQVGAHITSVMHMAAFVATLNQPVMIIETNEEKEIEWVKFIEGKAKSILLIQAPATKQ